MTTAQVQAIRQQELERKDTALDKAVRGAIREAEDVGHELARRNVAVAALYKALGSTVLGEVNARDLILTEDEQFGLIEIGLEQAASLDEARATLEAALSRARRLLDGQAKPGDDAEAGHEPA